MQSIGTIVTGLVILAVVAAIVIKLIRDKRKGKCPGCSCGCGSGREEKSE
ncbi:MAG: FeoB-associated Cys-rich membrane protein [Treponema sp.]|nr:FeoB-associated Cys-rich membrane protein [Treponema sp.]